MCHQPFATGSVGYPDVAEEPAEVWTPPEWPIETSVSDGDGHPLTWGRVAAAHVWLVRHASCESQGAADYSSDEEGAPPGGGCPCTWHPVMIEERSSHLAVCRAWPGQICGSCWAASCDCGRVFEATSDAVGRWRSGRLRCHACAS